MIDQPNRRRLAVILGGAAAAVIFAALIATESSRHATPAIPNNSSSKGADITADDLKAKVDAYVAAHKDDPMPWFRNDSVDGMTDQRIAQICTANKDSSQPLIKLCLLDHPRNGGQHVILQFDRDGMFDCAPGCFILIRFDDGPAHKILAGLQAPDVFNSLWPTESDALIAKLLSAKRVRIEAPIYSEGREVLEYDARGLVWTPRPTESTEIEDYPLHAGSVPSGLGVPYSRSEDRTASSAPAEP